MPSSKEYMREYQRNWLKARRQRFINLLGAKCKLCKSRENLEFDHVEPEKRAKDINRLMSGKLVKLLTELEKCQLLCRACHHNKTQLEFWGGDADHGTLRMYKIGCRCDNCRSNKSAEDKVRRNPK